MPVEAVSTPTSACLSSPCCFSPAACSGWTKLDPLQLCCCRERDQSREDSITAESKILEAWRVCLPMVRVHKAVRQCYMRDSRCFTSP
jgi:hypothetical protein